MNKEKYISYSKSVAALFVILYHTFGGMDIDSNLLGKLLLFLYTTHVPTFMLISGYLYSKYTIKHGIKYRVCKILNLLLCFCIYVALLVMFRLVVCIVGGEIISFKSIMSITVHNMWYFPTLCISMFIYEIYYRNHRYIKLFLCSMLIPIDIVLLYTLPSLGKVLIYVFIFFVGTYWNIDRDKSIRYILVNVFLWLVIVILYDIVNISTEGKSGFDLCLMMLLTVLGSLFIPSIIYLCTTYYRVRHNCLSHYFEEVLMLICNNTQLIYFFQFFIIIIIEATRRESLIGYSIIECLVYSFLCFSFSLIASTKVSQNAFFRRILLYPINIS